MFSLRIMAAKNQWACLACSIYHERLQPLNSIGEQSRDHFSGKKHSNSMRNVGDVFTVESMATFFQLLRQYEYANTATTNASPNDTFRHYATECGADPDEAIMQLAPPPPPPPPGTSHRIQRNIKSQCYARHSPKPQQWTHMLYCFEKLHSHP